MYNDLGKHKKVLWQQINLTNVTGVVTMFIKLNSAEFTRVQLFLGGLHCTVVNTTT